MWDSQVRIKLIITVRVCKISMLYSEKPKYHHSWLISTNIATGFHLRMERINKKISNIVGPHHIWNWQMYCHLSAVNPISETFMLQSFYKLNYFIKYFFSKELKYKQKIRQTYVFSNNIIWKIKKNFNVCRVWVNHQMITFSSSNHLVGGSHKQKMCCNLLHQKILKF